MAKEKFDQICTVSGCYKTRLNKMYLSRKPWVRPNPKQVFSFMPGMVERLNVQVGDTVKEGDLLMVFRAMKMSNNMLAPVAGKIAKINVQPGENVAKEVLMIEME